MVIDQLRQEPGRRMLVVVQLVLNQRVNVQVRVRLGALDRGRPGRSARVGDGHGDRFLRPVQPALGGALFVRPWRWPNHHQSNRNRTTGRPGAIGRSLPIFALLAPVQRRRFGAASCRHLTTIRLLLAIVGALVLAPHALLQRRHTEPIIWKASRAEPHLDTLMLLLLCCTFASDSVDVLSAGMHSKLTNTNHGALIQSNTHTLFPSPLPKQLVL